MLSMVCYSTERFGNWSLENYGLWNVKREPNVLQGSETTIFPCECWLAKSEDDGETVRELVPSEIITEKLLRDGTLKHNEIEVEDALESMWLSYCTVLGFQSIYLLIKHK